MLSNPSGILWNSIALGCYGASDDPETLQAVEIETTKPSVTGTGLVI